MALVEYKSLEDFLPELASLQRRGISVKPCVISTAVSHCHQKTHLPKFLKSYLHEPKKINKFFSQNVQSQIRATALHTCARAFEDRVVHIRKYEPLNKRTTRKNKCFKLHKNKSFFKFFFTNCCGKIEN